MKKKKKASRKRPPMPRRPGGYGLQFVRRSEVLRDHLAFLGALDRAIEFHRTNTNDPHNIRGAVMVAVGEIRDAFKAYMI